MGGARGCGWDVLRLMAVVEAVVEAWKGSSERVYEGRGRYGVWGRD